MDWMSLLNEQTVIGLMQLVLGRWLKGVKEFENRWVPVATFVLAVLGFSIAPVTAHAAGALTPAVPMAGVFLSALGQNLMITGMHSSWKNTVAPAILDLLGWAASKLVGVTRPR